jgi:hypothetical protein
MTWPDPLNPEVKQGLNELQLLFGELKVNPDGQGGARVTVVRVPLADGMSRSEAWCGFLIPFNYDDVQVYGHHFPRDLRRANGSEFSGAGFSYGGTWEEMPSLVVSRSSQHWRKGVDTAALKLVKVLEFLRGRAS